jgi:AcrR family transcriptional regulator
MAQPNPYHKENLRQTLIAAAVGLVGEVGPRAFTLREVARRAGVSHNAPYRHFAAKDDLLAAVAEEGFAQLTASMRKWMRRGADAIDRLQLSGCGYVDFALRWPNHFQVMFDLPLESLVDRMTNPAGAEAFNVLLDCILAAQQSGQLPAGDPMPQALTCWSLMHGISKLSVSGNLPMSRAATLKFVRGATRVLSGGLPYLKA